MSMDIHRKPVDMDMDMDGKFHIHGKPGDISASLMYCMDVHKTKVTRPRPRRYIFKTEMFDFSKLCRPRRDRDVQPSRPGREETFQKNVSRPSQDPDVQDRNYIPAYPPTLTPLACTGRRC